uniref:EGF-like domain-containing protein n=1 Tax=Caenorhabditis japonica TaxID=281687 RepID=A0A8R1DLL2_CAEJA
MYRDPPESKAFNLHNPCAYGKCQMKSHRLQCICFRQYTGLYCEKAKDWSWLLVVTPYLLILIVIIAYIVFHVFISTVLSNRKQEKIMGISGFACYSDRSNISLGALYPFMRKIRICRYDSDEEVVMKRKNRATTKNNEEVSTPQVGWRRAAERRPHKRIDSVLKRKSENKNVTSAKMSGNETTEK